jgi:hypothetical protein
MQNKKAIAKLSGMLFTFKKKQLKDMHPPVLYGQLENS